MPHVSKTCDVFISHAVDDAPLAREIANACRANGLDAITYAELLPAADISQVLWDALAESRALLAVLSRSGPTPSMAIELGAARAWNKPIFGVVADPTFADLPPGLSGIHLYPLGRVDDVIRAIKSSGKELSEEDRSLLARLYTEIGVSVDELALDLRHLEELVRRFGAGTGKALPGERLLSELLRMRKQGKLMKGRSSGRSKPNRGTA
jgi:TIR domain